MVRRNVIARLLYTHFSVAGCGLMWKQAGFTQLLCVYGTTTGPCLVRCRNQHALVHFSYGSGSEESPQFADRHATESCAGATQMKVSCGSVVAAFATVHGSLRQWRWCRVNLISSKALNAVCVCCLP